MIANLSYPWPSSKLESLVQMHLWTCASDFEVLEHCIPIFNVFERLIWKIMAPDDFTQHGWQRYQMNKQFMRGGAVTDIIVTCYFQKFGVGEKYKSRLQLRREMKFQWRLHHGEMNASQAAHRGIILSGLLTGECRNMGTNPPENCSSSQVYQGI